jgi:putative NADH-flavin reductase
MQITVFGAGGKVGSIVVEEALRRGHTVIAFVHSHSLFSPSGQLIIQKGDIYSAADVEQAIRGSQAVVSCLGSWGTPRRDVLSSAVRMLIPAMEAAHIRRIVTLTGSGAAAPADKVGVGHRLLLQALASFPAGKVFRDGEEHMRLLAASSLDWTTVRSPVMTGTGKPTYRLGSKAPSPFSSISRKAVSTCMLDQLESTEFLHDAPIIFR